MTSFLKAKTYGHSKDSVQRPSAASPFRRGLGFTAVALGAYAISASLVPSAVAAGVSASASAPAATVPSSTNLLLNGSFEHGTYSPSGLPNFWMQDAWRYGEDWVTFLWDDKKALLGSKSVRIHAPQPNDARWRQTISVQPNTLYELSGWIKTRDVNHANEESEDGAAGANLAVMAGDGSWYDHSDGLFGNQDWTHSSLLFNSKDQTQALVDARLGFFSGTTAGTAWFDGLRVREVGYRVPHPRWKILVLIYKKTDFTYTDTGTNETHHYVARMNPKEMAGAEAAARQFARIDVPALTSQNMIPRLTIRYPQHPLTDLEAIGNGFWPGLKSTRDDRDPSFDSVIVIWDETGRDALTGEDLYIGGGYGGLTPNQGTKQTYSTFTVNMATNYGAYNSTNVFKHEWGHSILSFYEAAGVAPVPAIDNHIDVQNPQYVHCTSGEDYILLDETNDNPIPNSIYNNDSGFTHDYYSGTTALRENKTQCLGITPDAWARGGPVTRP